MDAKELEQDVRDGKLEVGHLIQLIVMLQRNLDAANKQIEQLKKRIEELEKQLGGPPDQKVDEPFSVKAEEKRQAARAGKKAKKRKPIRRGRLSTEEKIKRAERAERVYPEGLAPKSCVYSHTRVVWRLENGRAVLVAYEVYRGGRNQYGQIPGTLGKCEFGIEFVIQIAFLVYNLGLSFDKVCLLMNFFQNLKLTKSQADSLMNRLARRWEREIDTLCTLLANSAVVHADETSWSIRSVWAFLSEKARLLFYGVHKDGDTLQHILDSDSFEGVVVSDNAAVYANFNQTQKCWAHLLRKAIKLTLQDPQSKIYRDFADGLLEIYRKSRRLERDGRFSEAGRSRKVGELVDAMIALCAPHLSDDSPTPEGPEDDFRRLVNEIVRLLARAELFTFVTEPAVEPTNNEAERTLRNPAQARKTGRTSKTIRGARRQSIVHSVLESLRAHLPTFTLSSVTAEVIRWSRVGRSCFTELLETLGLTVPSHSVLDLVLPETASPKAAT
jgi:hypothetical protein